MIEREEQQGEQEAPESETAPPADTEPEAQPEPQSEASAPEPEAPAAEPEEELSPKERRTRERSAHGGEALPARSPEERARERAEARRRKAVARRAWRVRSRERRKAAGPRGPARTERVAGAGGRPRERRGVVISDRADKTITVRIDVTRRHRTYKKIVRSSSTLHAHDERNEAGIGDTVRVVESRPLSRTKRWRLLEVTERAR